MQKFNIEEYVDELIVHLRQKFAERLLYVGLQGSFRRGEASDESDIDIMVTLDRLTVTDLDDYRAIIAEMPYFERSCGFISGREELQNWQPYEVCQLLHETKDCYGKLSPLLPAFTKDDIKNHIAISIGNLYHMLCHSRIHGAPEHGAEILKNLYKSVFYILQNVYYLQSGEWIMTKADLLPLLQGINRSVLQMALAAKSGTDYDAEAYSILFDWCQMLFHHRAKEQTHCAEQCG